MDEEHQKEIRAFDEAAKPEGPLDAGATLSLEDQLHALTAEVEELKREKNQFREMGQRAQADLINYKRRAEEEREQQQINANSRLILKLLPVLDEFNLAMDHASKSDAEPSWLEGVSLIQRKLNSILQSESVTRIDVGGVEFDPLEHESMGYQDSDDHEEDQILTVVRDGYKLHGRVIRPSLVILARKPGNAGEDSSPSTEKETQDA